MTVFLGVSHLDLSVRDLARAQALYVDVLGLSVHRAGEGWVDLDSGTVRLRLIEVAQPKETASLRIQVNDVEGAYRHLLAQDLRDLSEPMRTPELELVASVVDPDGHTLHLWRPLSEDEYGFDPELPTEMTWEPEATVLLQSMLKSVPALFRGLARRKVTKNAEWYAQSTNRVTCDHVVRAFIISNAKVNRERAKKPLIDHGYNPEDYHDEFES